ncbi:MAG: hypothetical protein RLZZ390_765, partial [Bacteroidota bacterium]
KGKHVYPGLILANSNLGLIEINSVRATADATEIGEYNPSIRSLVAYNTDSKVINTLKSNGITHANIVPEGGTEPSVVVLLLFSLMHGTGKMLLMLLIMACT